MKNIDFKIKIKSNQKVFTFHVYPLLIRAKVTLDLLFRSTNCICVHGTVQLQPIGPDAVSRLKNNPTFNLHKLYTLPKIFWTQSLSQSSLATLAVLSSIIGQVSR